MLRHFSPISRLVRIRGELNISGKYKEFLNCQKIAENLTTCAILEFAGMLQDLQINFVFQWKPVAL